jgi:hypothetical protein
LFLTALFLRTYSEAAEAAAAGAAFFFEACFVCFFVALCADEAGAIAPAAGAEACAKAADAKRPATRAAMSLFIV